MNKYFNSANWQKSYPVLIGMTNGMFFYWHQISFDKSVFTLSADISAVLFGFALTFMGFLISASDTKYLQETRKYKERYLRLLRFSKEAVYGCLCSMIISLISIIDRIHNFVYKHFEIHFLEILWAFIIAYTIMTMFRIFRITIWILGYIK